jgi:hypothetical protein
MVGSDLPRPPEHEYSTYARSMFQSWGIPNDVDAETHLRIARTFFLLRMVKGAFLLLFLVGILVAVELKEWPRAAAALVGVGILVEVWVLVRSAQRYAALRESTNGSQAP